MKNSTDFQPFESFEQIKEYINKGGRIFVDGGSVSSTGIVYDGWGLVDANNPLVVQREGTDALCHKPRTSAGVHFETRASSVFFRV